MVGNDSRISDALPAEVTSLIGRTHETAEVRRLLGRSRLVTLTGPGGVGKTRLARHLARGVRSAFPDGVFVVPLAELSQPDLVAPTVLFRLGVVRASGADVADMVGDLADRRLLLVLDNCEHVVESTAALVAALLRSCPQLVVLATSRSALQVEGEVIYPVPPLALPHPGAVLATGAAMTYDGIALFMDRAAMVSHDFAAGRVDERAVVELCQRLDGLPLAIELAAAGTRVLSVETLLDRAADPLSVPATSARTAPGRHLSLRASLEYSHELCSVAARLLWSRLSVFRGGSSLGSIEDVCSGRELSREGVAPALVELVDKSVVQFAGSQYRMLEAVRQFGAERLGQAGEEEWARDQHLGHFAGLSETVSRHWFGPTQSDLLERLVQNQPNLRAALEWSLTRTTSGATGLRMATDLYPLWIGAGLPGEGRRWLGRLLTATDATAPERASALWVQGFLAAVDGDIPTARELLEAARTAAADTDAASAAHATSALGLADLFDARVTDAIARVEAAVAAERQLPDNDGYLAEALINLGLCYCFAGDLAAASAALEEARVMCAAHGEELLHSWALVVFGLVRLLEGDVAAAVDVLADGLRRKRAISNGQGIAWAVELLAWAAVEVGDPLRAAVLLGACEAWAADLGTLLHGSAGMVEQHEQYVRRARDLIGDGPFRNAADRGARLSMDDLIAFALGEVGPPAPGPASPLDALPLTPREREIAILVADGKSNREIAEELVIASRTVDTHVQHILTKLDFTSRSQVVALIAGSRAPRG